MQTTSRDCGGFALKHANALGAAPDVAGSLAEYAFEHAAIWMAAADADLRIVAANAAWRRGFNDEKTVGRPLGDFLNPDLLAVLDGAEKPGPPSVMDVG